MIRPSENVAEKNILLPCGQNVFCHDGCFCVMVEIILEPVGFRGDQNY
jgi:hypothetical protein